MNTWRFFRSRSWGGRWFVLLTTLLLVAGLIAIPAPAPAWAMRPVPPDGGDDRVDQPEPPFQPPQGGFAWSVPRRYGLDENLDDMVDAHYNPATFNYDPAYLYPDYWPMQFSGCHTEYDADHPTATSLTYTWSLDGHTFSGHECVFTYDDPGFPAQGTYLVTLTVTYQDGTTASFPQQVYVKDYFLVAIGDSYAAGEGNPDIPQPTAFEWGLGWVPIGPATWQDQRCHRSADAFPSRAAMDLEMSDPHTSVTFISYACSGATISTPLYDAYTSPFGAPSWDLPRGTGVTGPYRGQDVPLFASYDPATYVPSQLGQLQLALQPPAGETVRQIDALIVSAGGNDLHFGDILGTCVGDLNCYPNAYLWETPGQQVQLGTFLNMYLASSADGGAVPYNVPDALADLKRGIDGINKLLPNPAKVFITQYPDQTRADTYGVYCDLLWDVFWGSIFLKITPEESAELVDHALHPLNLAIQTAAAEYDWQYVDGLTSYEVDPNPDKPAGTPGLFVRDETGRGHGYCASQNWIIRAEEAELIQGPWPFLRFKGTGAMHPNMFGIQAIRTRLLYYLRPYLQSTLPGDPPGDPPSFGSSFTSGGFTSVPGAGGWFTHSCDASNTCFPQVVLQVTATGTAPLLATSVSVDGQAGCGDLCTRTVYTQTNEVIWDFNFAADGIYRMQFSAGDSNNQIAAYTSEIKVDLHDPVFDPPPGPFEVGEGITTTLTAQTGEGNSEEINYDWDLDNDSFFETTDERPVFSAAALDGPASQTVRVRATDQAGRTATAMTAVNVKNVAPMAKIEGVPPSSSEGTAINLSSSVIDPGVDDTFNYVWEVKKNGSHYASGANVNLSFTPDDNGSYEVSLTVADDDDGVATAGQTIEVANVAPALSNVTVSPGTVNEGGSVSLGGSISDAGSADAFALTIDWGDGSTAELVSVPAGSTGFSRSHTYADDNPTGTASDTYAIALTIADDDAGTGTGSASVVVNNLAPSLSISAPESGALYAVNAAVDVSASLADPSSLDTLTCSVDWGDGVVESGTLAAGACTASHAYTAAGVYTIQMTGADDDTGAKTESAMVVVYDPSAGFVTGGGWINSPAGAYRPDESLSGKATFGFVSKYQKGASVPTGNTAFQFQVGGLEFHSTAYEWLVVNQGGTNAQFKGSGTVNGGLDPNGNEYKFMIWATDGSPDTFHIRIWWDDAGSEIDIYDNGTDQAIGGGNIVVHTGK